MLAFYAFLSTYAELIYIILLFGGLFVARRLWVAWREWQGAVYNLERQITQRRFTKTIALAAVWFSLLLGVFLTTSFVIPAMPPSALLPTPTVDLLVTPTGTISAEMAATLAARPAPNPADYSEGCVPGKIILDSPLPGENLKGIVELVGTVDIPDFGFYKFEVSPAGAENWSTIYAGREVIHDDVLGRMDTGELIPGDYYLRLIATNNQGEALPPCVVQVRVIGQAE